MKENNLNESPIENNDINENQNQVKIENKSDNKEITIQSEDNEKLPLKESNQNQNQVEKNKTVMIGDALSDILAAQQAGISAIGALWGYGLPYPGNADLGEPG